MRAATHRSPGAPPGSHGLAHRDPHPEGGEVRSLLSALRSSARAAPAHPTTLSSPSPFLRSPGPHQLIPAGCPGKSDALYSIVRDFDNNKLLGAVAVTVATPPADGIIGTLVRAPSIKGIVVWIRNDLITKAFTVGRASGLSYLIEHLLGYNTNDHFAYLWCGERCLRREMARGIDTVPTRSRRIID